MATSEDGHYVRYQSSLVDADEPTDTGIHRRAMGNLDHVADQFAQTRVRWVSHGNQYYTLDSSLSLTTGEYYLLWRSSFFDLHVAPVGSSGEMRSYGLRCSTLAASASGNVTIYTALSLPEDSLFRITSGESDVGSSFRGTGYGWADQPNLDDGGLMYLNDAHIRRARAAAPSVDSVGGRVTAVPWVRVCLSVYGVAASGGGEPRLRGVELTEYLEP